MCISCLLLRNKRLQMFWLKATTFSCRPISWVGSDKSGCSAGCWLRLLERPGEGGGGSETASVQAVGAPVPAESLSHGLSMPGFSRPSQGSQNVPHTTATAHLAAHRRTALRTWLSGKDSEASSGPQPGPAPGRPPRWFQGRENWSAAPPVPVLACSSVSAVAFW